MSTRQLARACPALLALFLLVGGASRAARAQEGDTARVPAVDREVSEAPSPSPPPPLLPPQPKPPRLRHWYGWQVIAGDLAGTLTLVVCASAVDSPACLSLYPAAGAFIHGIHNQSAGRVLGSIALHVVLPVLGGVIGAASADCREDEWLCGLAETGIGMLIGAGAATAIDAALSFEDIDPNPRERSVARRRGVRIAPAVTYVPGNATLGIRGSF
jgi:hypothetical protein